ncbi:phosphotransferase enzyme family protein [Alkalihalobacillus sp. CinArs1]|uniref:phosphotransferase enzyme family protein n=1 Tax=Alkalihalobacillus sp. CinArs1 TaxID=2995314 RepID=UPI0022DE7610|nr:phosphotransferase [Alkalihalobacillus sp. CinArs1]
MEARVEKCFNEAVLVQALEKFGADRHRYKKLGDFENYVFEVDVNGPSILRLTHSSHRSMEDVKAELHWVNFLHDHEINVSRALPSKNDHFVEEIEVEDGSFFVSLFEKAPGRQLKKNDEVYGQELYEVWGRTIGKMHHATKDYHPEGAHREHWDEEDLLQFEKYISEEDGNIISQGKALVREIQALPKERDTYGLLHSDIHAGNFFYYEGDIHVFDFDDSSYHYFVSDIAIPLYYTVWGGLQGEDRETRAQFAETFLYSFLKGYLKENTVEAEWIKKIPLFLKLRDYILYSVLHKKFDVMNMSEGEQQMLKQVKDRLDEGEPIAQPSYERLLQRLSKK